MVSSQVEIVLCQLTAILTYMGPIKTFSYYKIVSEKTNSSLRFLASLQQVSWLCCTLKIYVLHRYWPAKSHHEYPKQVLIKLDLQNISRKSNLVSHFRNRSKYLVAMKPWHLIGAGKRKLQQSYMTGCGSKSFLFAASFHLTTYNLWTNKSDYRIITGSSLPAVIHI